MKNYYLSISQALELTPKGQDSKLKEFILSKIDSGAMLMMTNPRGYYVLNKNEYEAQKSNGTNADTIFETMDKDRSFILTELIFEFMAQNDETKLEAFTLLHNMVDDLHCLLCQVAEKRGVDSKSFINANNFNSTKMSTNLNINLR